MKILIYDGSGPIIVPPEHTVIFREGTRVWDWEEKEKPFTRDDIVQAVVKGIAKASGENTLWTFTEAGKYAADTLGLKE